MSKLKHVFRAVAERQALAVLLVGLAAFGGSASAGLLIGIPEPKFHDEFSYLLAADTLARGRVTNPPHPMWMHFESMHIIQQPSYASKFPVGQGLMLALGQLLTGQAIAGVWLSAGLMCAAVCWMLYAWLPPRWALLGGFIVVARLGVVGYWAQSYWGGAVAAAGGALVFGAMRRLVAAPTPARAAVLGLGLAVLANTRPYEGLLVGLPVGIVLFRWVGGRGGQPLRQLLVRAGMPLATVLALTATAMAYYNLRVTGHPLRLPYQVHEETYRVEPIFLWKSPRPEPEYHHQALREFHTGFELKMYRNQRPIGGYGFRATKLDQFKELWKFYLGPFLTFALLGLPWIIGSSWVRVALATCAALATGLSLETWILAHYAAPITGLVFVLVMEALRQWTLRAPATGRFVTVAIVLASVGGPGVTIAAALGGAPAREWQTDRAAILQELEAQEGKDLVVVRYGGRHSVQNEWVYNEADIDRADVVWAREMDSSSNRRLTGYFSDRKIWLLEVDADTERPVVRPYRE